MVPVDTATYRLSSRKNTIDLIFAISLLSEKLISCDVAGNFDHDSDHQQILSMWTIGIIDNQLSL